MNMKATPTKKRKKKIAQKIFNDMDLNLKRVMKIEARLEKVEAEKAEAIEKVLSRARTKTKQLQDRKLKLEIKNEALLKGIKDKLGRNRSRKLNFGSIGYRRSKRLDLLPNWTWQQVLEKIIDMGGSKFLRITNNKIKDVKFVSVKRSLNKREIINAGLSIQELANIGLQIIERDRIWYKVAKMETKSTVEMDGKKNEGK